MNLRPEGPQNSLKREKNIRKAQLFLYFDFFVIFEAQPQKLQKKMKILSSAAAQNLNQCNCAWAAGFSRFRAAKP